MGVVTDVTEAWGKLLELLGHLFQFRALLLHPLLKVLLQLLTDEFALCICRSFELLLQILLLLTNAWRAD